MLTSDENLRVEQLKSEARRLRGQEANLSWDDWESGERPYESAVELEKLANSIETRARNNTF